MKNFTKTFKSEYHLGGCCTAQLLGNLLFVNFGDERTGIKENINEGGALARISQFLEFNTSPYEAEKVMKYINLKLQG